MTGKGRTYASASGSLWRTGDARSALGEATLGLAEEWKALLKAIAVPGAIVAAVNVAFQAQGEVPVVWALPFGLFSAVFGMMIAISCHRLMILGPAALPKAWGLFWTERETRFLGWSLGLGLISGGVVLLAGVVVGVIVVAVVASQGLEMVRANVLLPAIMVTAMIPVFLVVMYLSARLILVLPATAIGERPTLKESWRLTHSNGWRLFLVMWLPSFFLVPMTMVGSFVLPGLLLRFISAFTIVVLGLIGVAALSKSYLFLARPSQSED